MHDAGTVGEYQTSPSSFSPSSSGCNCRSGLILGLLETNRPLVSPFSPSSLPALLPADGDRDMYRALDRELDVDRDLLRPLRRSGDESRDDGGVREGVRDESRTRFALGDAASSGSSS